QAEGIYQFSLQLHLPAARSISIVSSSIGQNEQTACTWIPASSLPAPPAHNRVYREIRRGPIQADVDGSSIGLRIVDPVGHRLGEGIIGEVVHVNVNGFLGPELTCILKQPHQFLLLGVDADNDPAG